MRAGGLEIRLAAFEPVEFAILLERQRSMALPELDSSVGVSLRKSCDGGCGVLRGRRLRHAGRGA